MSIHGDLIRKFIINCNRMKITTINRNNVKVSAETVFLVKQEYENLHSFKFNY